MNIHIPEHVSGVPLGDSTHTIAQSARRCVNEVKPDNDVNIHITEHLSGVPLGDSTHTIAQSASCCVNLVKPDNDWSIQKLSDRPYTEMARCVNLVKPKNDVNIRMFYDKPYLEVQSDLDEFSAIGGGGRRENELGRVDVDRWQ